MSCIKGIESRLASAVPSADFLSDVLVPLHLGARCFDEMRAPVSTLGLLSAHTNFDGSHVAVCHWCVHVCSLTLFDAVSSSSIVISKPALYRLCAARLLCLFLPAVFNPSGDVSRSCWKVDVCYAHWSDEMRLSFSDCWLLMLAQIEVTARTIFASRQSSGCSSSLVASVFEFSGQSGVHHLWGNRCPCSNCPTHFDKEWVAVGSTVHSRGMQCCTLWLLVLLVIIPVP